jgi:hypothetical protein
VFLSGDSLRITQASGQNSPYSNPEYTIDLNRHYSMEKSFIAVFQNLPKQITLLIGGLGNRGYQFPTLELRLNYFDGEGWFKEGEIPPTSQP